MKEILFTAIAVVAFSGVGFAKSNLKFKVEKKAIVFSCAGFATRMTEAIEEMNDECLSGEDYTKTVAYWNAMCIIMGGS